MRTKHDINKHIFKYDDPYVKDQIVTCPICEHLAFEDQYGNGECSNCGWKFSKNENEFENIMKISYPMLVPTSRAKEQYRQGKPFKATFDDFINGLKFYSEMLFDHNGITYEVFYGKNNSIIFCSSDFQQEYKTEKDFYDNANIYGRKLKDIWHEVEKPRFMHCG